MPPAFQANAKGQRVALFVTCLVDLFRPSVGFAAVKLIEQAGFTVEVPEIARSSNFETIANPLRWATSRQSAT